MKECLMAEIRCAFAPFITNEDVLPYYDDVCIEINRAHDALKQQYDSVYAPLYSVYDKNLQQEIIAAVKLQQMRTPSLCIIIGIGGSNLGTLAVDEALHGRKSTARSKMFPVYYVDTIDSDDVYRVLQIAKAALERREHITINVISKSGTTTETIINFEFFVSLCKQYTPDSYHEYFVVTTDADSPLWHYAHKHAMQVLEIPHLVGGRYSIFSAVGLFPLSLMGVDIHELCAGAHDMLTRGFNVELSHNYSAQRALFLYNMHQQVIRIHDMFVFSPDLESLGKWYRQLMGESLGKSETRDGRKTDVGILPTVSVGSTDLHSVGQYYLSADRYMSTTFVYAAESHHTCTISSNTDLEQLVPHIAGKTMQHVMHAIIEGTQRAYTSQKMPYATCVLPSLNARYIGQFMQMCILEIIYMGYLLQINPFNQPHVELYKKETRKILADE